MDNFFSCRYMYMFVDMYVRALIHIKNDGFNLVFNLVLLPPYFILDFLFLVCGFFECTSAHPKTALAAVNCHTGAGNWT